MKFFFPKTKQAIREAFNLVICTMRSLIDVIRAHTAALNELSFTIADAAQAIRDQNTTIAAIERNTKFLANVERDHLSRAGHKHPSEG